MLVIESRPEEHFQVSHDSFHFGNLTDDENTRFLNDVLRRLTRHFGIENIFRALQFRETARALKK
jgi:hypothetical protein